MLVDENVHQEFKFKDYESINIKTDLMLVWPPRSHTVIINIFFNIVYCVTHTHLETSSSCMLPSLR